LDEECPFCHSKLEFYYVGPHWQFRCLNKDCEGDCIIRGKNKKDIMKKLNVKKIIKHLFVLSVILTLILTIGCATIPKCPPCPPENTIFITPDGLVEMPKGFFDTGEGRNWMHTDDYKKQRRDTIEKQEGGF